MHWIGVEWDSDDKADQTFEEQQVEFEQHFGEQEAKQTFQEQQLFEETFPEAGQADLPRAGGQANLRGAGGQGQLRGAQGKQKAKQTFQDQEGNQSFEEQQIELQQHFGQQEANQSFELQRHFELQQQLWQQQLWQQKEEVEDCLSPLLTPPSSPAEEVDWDPYL